MTLTTAPFGVLALRWAVVTGFETASPGDDFDTGVGANVGAAADFTAATVASAGADSVPDADFDSAVDAAFHSAADFGADADVDVAPRREEPYRRRSSRSSSRSTARSRSAGKSVGAIA